MSTSCARAYCEIALGFAPIFEFAHWGALCSVPLLIHTCTSKMACQDKWTYSLFGKNGKSYLTISEGRVRAVYDEDAIRHIFRAYMTPGFVGPYMTLFTSKVHGEWSWGMCSVHV